MSYTWLYASSWLSPPVNRRQRVRERLQISGRERSACPAMLQIGHQADQKALPHPKTMLKECLLPIYTSGKSELTTALRNGFANAQDDLTMLSVQLLEGWRNLTLRKGRCVKKLLCLTGVKSEGHASTMYKLAQLYLVHHPHITCMPDCACMTASYLLLHAIPT